MEECRQPLSRSYGPRLPNSLALIILPRLGLFCQDHLYWFWVRTLEITPAFLFKGSRIQPNPLAGARHCLTECSSLRDFSGLSSLTTMRVVGISPSVEIRALRCPTYSCGTRILTRFPL